MHFELPISGDRDLRHFSHQTPKRFMHRQAASVPLRECCPPSGLVSGELKDSGVAGVLTQQRPAKCQGVFARRVRQFIDKALDHERRMRMAHGPPPQGGDAVGSPLPVHQQIGNIVGQLGGPFDGGVVHAIFDDRGFDGRTRDEGLTDDAMLPGHGISRRIQTTTDRVIGHRSVVATTGVIFTRPNDFDWRLDGFRNLHRLAHEVAVEDGAPAEAAT